MILGLNFMTNSLQYAYCYCTGSLLSCGDLMDAIPCDMTGLLLFIGLVTMTAPCL